MSKVHHIPCMAVVWTHQDLGDMTYCGLRITNRRWNKYLVSKHLNKVTCQNCLKIKKV